MGASVTHSQLLDACVAGDRDSCMLLLEPYLGLVRTILNRVAPGLVADGMQELYIKVVAKIHQYRQGTDFRAWLCRIARNMALDYLRQSRQSSTCEVDGLAAKPQDPASRLVEREERSALWDCVDSLRPHEAAFFRRRYSLGEEPRETAMFFADQWIDTAPLPPAKNLSQPEKIQANQSNRETLKKVVGISLTQFPPNPDGSASQKNRQDQASEKISEITRNFGPCMSQVRECMNRKVGSG